MSIYNLHELARVLGYKHPNTLRYILQKRGVFNTQETLYIHDLNILVVRSDSGRLYFILNPGNFINKLKPVILYDP